MKQIRINDNAFTGLEAAIVLIAFVVVAAVFSYVVLGAGFFTTQKAQETVHTSVSQASSSLEVIGNVIGHSANSANLDYLSVTVGLTAGGTSMDLDTMVMSYNDGTTRTNDYAKVADATALPGTTQWCIFQKINANANAILEPGEQFILRIGVPTTALPNVQFTLNLQPSTGAVTQLVRTVPAALNTINMLY
jgi:flagellin FlaB